MGNARVLLLSTLAIVSACGSSVSESDDAGATHDATTDGGTRDASIDGGGNDGGGDDDGGAGDGGAGDASDAADAGDAASDAAAQDAASADAGCSAPDVLIVLDRSGSMTAPFPTFPPSFTPKWTIVRDVLNTSLPTHDAALRFGLLEFPTDDDCAVVSATAVRVAIDLDQAPAIASYFSARTPNGNSPTARALETALSHYEGLVANPAGRHVVLITDGAPNCSTDPPSDTVAAASALATAGIDTYVIGLTPSGSDDAVLSDVALAGAVPRPGGPPHYYAASDAAALGATLDAIFEAIVAPCAAPAPTTP